MSSKYLAGPDIDLDVEIVKDKKGQRVTERRAQAIAAEALSKAGVGRPSLTRPGTHSPEITGIPVPTCGHGLRAPSAGHDPSL